MAWENIGDGLYGGDAALDAWSRALDDATAAAERGGGPKPSLAALVAAVDEVLRAHGLRADQRALAALRSAADAPGRPGVAPPAPRTGDVLAIPYDGGRSVVALVLLGDDARKLPGNPGLGPCVAAFDLDVPDSGLADPDVLRHTPWIVPPFHPVSVEGWPTLGRVAIPVDRAVLPCFAAGERPGRSGRVHATPYPPGYVRVVRDYFGERADPPEATADRTIPAHAGGAEAVIAAIRARRASAERGDAATTHAMAPWPTLCWQRPKRTRAAKAPPADLHARLVTALAPAVRRCEDAWLARWERPPTAEEHVYAVRQVVRSAPHRYVSDPGRVV